MSLTAALEADRAGNLELAASEYEDVLVTKRYSLETLLNLAILYWQATDPGLAASKELSSEFLALAGRRYPELLEEAQRHYPASPAVRFWKLYIDWAELGEPLDVRECQRLLRENPDVLEPAVWLFAASRGTEAKREAKELLLWSRQEGTTRARYIASVIEGVMKRSGLGTPRSL